MGIIKQMYILFWVVKFLIFWISFYKCPTLISHNNSNCCLLCLETFLTVGRAPPKYNSVSHNWLEKRIRSHYQCWMRHVRIQVFLKEDIFESSAGGIDVVYEEVHCFVYSRSQFLDWRTWARMWVLALPHWRAAVSSLHCTVPSIWQLKNYHIRFVDLPCHLLSISAVIHCFQL